MRMAITRVWESRRPVTPIHTTADNINASLMATLSLSGIQFQFSDRATGWSK